MLGGLAQSVEQRNHNPCVCGSTPQTAIILRKEQELKQKIFISLFGLAAFLFLLGCGQKSDEVTPILPQKNVQRQLSAPAAVPKFTPPQTTGMDEKKAKQYANASAALLMLGKEWSLKIEQAKGDEKVLILQNYEKARDQVCIRTGLAGIAEYNWLTNVAVKDSSNAEVLKAAGIRF